MEPLSAEKQARITWWPLAASSTLPPSWSSSIILLSSQDLISPCLTLSLKSSSFSRVAFSPIITSRLHRRVPFFFLFHHIKRGLVLQFLCLHLLNPFILVLQKVLQHGLLPSRGNASMTSYKKFLHYNTYNVSTIEVAGTPQVLSRDRYQGSKPNLSTFLQKVLPPISEIEPNQISIVY